MEASITKDISIATDTPKLPPKPASTDGPGKYYKLLINVIIIRTQ